MFVKDFDEIWFEIKPNSFFGADSQIFIIRKMEHFIAFFNIFIIFLYFASLNVCVCVSVQIPINLQM